MKSLRYIISRGPVNEMADDLNLDPDYLSRYKSNIERQLSEFLKQIIDDEAEIELTVAPNGREILYWKIINWTEEGYDKLITSNVI